MNNILSKLLLSTILATGLSVLQGCSKSYEGEAFYDEGKYGGIHIYALDGKEVSKIIKDGEIEIQSEKQKIIDKIKLLDWKDIHKKDIYERSRGSFDYTSTEPLLLKELAKINIKELSVDIEKIETKKFFMIKLHDLLEKSKPSMTLTDSDGKFKIKVDNDYFIIAFATEKNLFWIVDPTKIQSKLQLTHKNFAGLSCTECVFNNEDADINKAGSLRMLMYYLKKYNDKNKNFIDRDDLISIIYQARKSGFN